MMNRPVFITGLGATGLLVALLFVGLGRDPKKIESPLIGKAAPNFELRRAGSSDSIALDSFRGKPVVLNFWATWCVPCWEEHPILNQASRAYGDRVQFLGVVFQDEESRILRFLEQRGSAYPTVVDERGKTGIAYGVGGVPETFVIDSSGRIVAKHDGPISVEQLQTYLTEASQ